MCLDWKIVYVFLSVACWLDGRFLGPAGASTTWAVLMALKKDKKRAWNSSVLIQAMTC